MIYGPYKRKGKLKMTKLPQHATHYGYNARPDKRIVRLRLALAASLTALAALGIKMLYLTPTTLGMAGMAVLAGYRMWHKPGQSLDDYLADEVFAGMTGTTQEPDPEDVAGFNAFTARFVKGLAAEKAAVETL